MVAAGGAASAGDARSDARRPGRDAERIAHPSRRRLLDRGRRDSRASRRSRRPASFSDSIRSMSPTKASSSRSSRPRRPTRCSPRCAQHPLGREARDHRPRGRGRQPFRRDAHGVRRRADRRLAGGRAIAADLLEAHERGRANQLDEREARRARARRRRRAAFARSAAARACATSSR